MNFLFDTHCHFDSIQDAREQLPRAYEVGLRAINVIGCDVETTKRSLEVVRMVEAEKDKLGLFDLDAKATVGLHPHEAQHLSDQQNELESLLEQNDELISGIGETGYDLFYKHSSIEEQKEAFIWQIGLSKKLNRTMVVHTRDAWEETFELLGEQGWPDKTVLHCFTGGPDEALKAVQNGAYISISGIVTFKNAKGIQDAIEAVPLNKLLCETDAPWLAPVPHRGKSNEPSYISFVIDAIADIRQVKYGEDRDLVTKSLFDNGKRLFR